ncbi:MAG: aminopeptidase, partial [Stenotrophomonas sp.]
MRSPFLMLPLAVALVAGCAKEPAAPTVDPVAQKPAAAVNTVSRSHDESSYAEPDKVVIKDLALDLKVDFDTKQIGGTATYTLEWKDKAAKQLLLDTRELTVEKVEALAADGTATALQFALAPADKVFGSKLSIETPAQPTTVRISYHTAPTASGLQWLEPSMTEGKKLPF